MKRIVFFLLVILGLGGVWACQDNPTSIPAPSFANGVPSNYCNPARYPNYGGIWAITLTPASVTIDSSTDVGWGGLTSTRLEALVWRDNASFPGNQLYCVDTFATMHKVSWVENDPSDAIVLLTGVEDPLGTTWPNRRAVGVRHTGTARPYVVYSTVPTIRDTSTIWVVK